MSKQATGGTASGKACKARTSARLWGWCRGGGDEAGGWSRTPASRHHGPGTVRRQIHPVAEQRRSARPPHWAVNFSAANGQEAAKRATWVPSVVRPPPGAVAVLGDEAGLFR